MRFLQKTNSSPDYAFIGAFVLLVIFGLVMLMSASSDVAKTRFGDSYYYLKHQILYGLATGIVGFFIGAFVYYRRWERFATILLIVSLISAFLVFTPLGLSVKGSERWLSFGEFTFQPSEFLKLSFFIYLAAWISKNQIRSKSFLQGLFPFLILVGSVVVLLIFQPSTTTAALIFAASLITYFTAGARFRFLVVTVLLGALALSLVIYITPYRLERVLTFLNPEADLLGSGYHINQALLAIGSGRITGVGFGESTTKLNYLPEPLGDSIFAVIAEELGFVGALGVVFIFLFLIMRGLSIAKNTSDTFGKLLVTGFICLIGLQAFVNIAAISGVVPLTGVPLPFISYGGTALTVFLTMCGIMVNVSKYRR